MNLRKGTETLHRSSKRCAQYIHMMEGEKSRDSSKLYLLHSQCRGTNRSL